MNYKIKRLGDLFVLFLLTVSCYQDLGNDDYPAKEEVTFTNSITTNYIFTADQEFELDAPVSFMPKPENIDDVYDIEWYLNRQLIYTGYHLKYTISKGGSYELVLKVIKKNTKETYLSEVITFVAKNNFDWGWMILSEGENAKSTLSFISPVLKPLYNIDQMIEGGLGSDPKGIYYYYVLGSIPGSYVSGLPKILINQGSGSVTLDGNTLQKDMYLADEFENHEEPVDLQIMDFAFKEEYYVIVSKEGHLYFRNVGYSNHEIPYYGSYNAMPYELNGGSKITCFAPFHNVTFWCGNEDRCMLFDEQNSRFVGIARNQTYKDPLDYTLSYLDTYDQELEVPSSVLRVNSMGVGTKCLAIGAYEKVYTDPETTGLTFWSNYVALLNINGSGNYNLFEFGVYVMNKNSNLITSTDQYAFSGSPLLTDKSLIHMSSNFEKNPYFYFTDGNNKLYVYSMQTRSHKLLYEADKRIVSICNSPIVCEFKKYGGNSEDPNYRLAVAQEEGTISILDVQKTKMVQLFEGFTPSVELKNLTGFGTIKGMVWCTNYQGEY